MISGQRLIFSTSIDYFFVPCIGLKVNLHKRKLYGVGVNNVDIDRFDGILKCDPTYFPFTYLGLPVGANMKLVRHWAPMVDRFKASISNWKMKYFLFGGA